MKFIFLLDQSFWSTYEYTRQVFTDLKTGKFYLRLQTEKSDLSLVTETRTERLVSFAMCARRSLARDTPSHFSSNDYGAAALNSDDCKCNLILLLVIR